MKTFLCDLKTDFSKIKAGNGDKIIILFEHQKSTEPSIPLSMFNVLNELKGNVEFKPVEPNMLSFAVSLILGYETALNNEVQVLLGLNIDPKLIGNLLISLNLTTSGRKKRASKSESNSKEGSSPLKQESIENFSMPKPTIEGKNDNDLEKLPKRRKKNDAESKEEDDIDMFMNFLADIDASLLNHTKHIVDAARLVKEENIIFAEALCRIAGETNGNKIFELISGKATEVFTKALEIKD